MMARQQKNREPATPNLRERANVAYEGARERAIEAYDNARERASVAREKAGQGIGEAPLLALGGGLALGALIGAVLPRTKVEERLLGDVGGRITGGARTAFDAAREAGREKLAELNITPDAGKGAVQTLVDGLTEAARSSGQAALEAARNKA
jgi:ElaB/YqjD/DUF883 family membrane-anchored ribosome-binding protein